MYCKKFLSKSKFVNENCFILFKIIFKNFTLNLQMGKESWQKKVFQTNC